MGVSIRLKSKSYKDGKSPVMIRIYHKGKESYKKTEVNVEKRFWDFESNKVTNQEPNYKSLNRAITTARLQYEKLYYDALSSSDPTDMDELFSSRKKVVLFEDLYEEYYEKISKESEGYKKKVRGILNSMNPYFKNVRFDDVDRRFIEKLVGSLRLISGNSNNTINFKIKKLREVVNYAITKKSIRGENPFDGFRVKANVIIKDSLTLKQLRAIEELDLNSSPAVALSRDVFLMQYYLHGSRVADVLMLKNEYISEEAIKFQQRKTGADIKVAIHEKMATIINSYKRPGVTLLFPIIDIKDAKNEKQLNSKIEGATTILNKNLKVIAKMCGIETNVSSHIARHSFANHADLMDIPVRVISKALGHASIQTTERYLAKVKANRINEQVNDIVYYNPLKNEK